MTQEISRERDIIIDGDMKRLRFPQARAAAELRLILDFQSESSDLELESLVLLQAHGLPLRSDFGFGTQGPGKEGGGLASGETRRRHKAARSMTSAWML